MAIGSCHSLTAVALSGFTSLSQVGYSFLSHCVLLKTVDMTGLTSLTQVGNQFLADCTSLTAVDQRPHVVDSSGRQVSGRLHVADDRPLR